MNFYRRIKAWLREGMEDKRLVAYYFGGPLEVGTPFGIIQIPETYPTDLYTFVYDTPHPEFRKAAILHDWCCDELRKYGRVLDVEGNVAIRTQSQADLAFLVTMIQSIRQIVIRLLHEGNETSAAALEAAMLGIRVLVYYKGVRRWDRLMRLVHVRK